MNVEMSLLVLFIVGFIFPIEMQAHCIGAGYEQQMPVRGVTLPKVSISSGISEIALGDTTTFQATANVDKTKGGQAFFLWCAKEGRFQYDSNFPDYSGIKYTAPVVSTNNRIKIFVIVGDGLGYVGSDIVYVDIASEVGGIQSDLLSGDVKIVFDPSDNLNIPGSITINGQPVQADWSVDDIAFNIYGITGKTFETFWQPVKLEVHDAKGQEIYSGCFPFKDVCAGRWYTRPVMKLWKEGLVQGYGEGKLGIFGPYNPALRAELVAVVVRALEQGNTPEPLTEPPFADVSIDDWFAVYVQYAKDTGFMEGCGVVKTHFCPGDPISRAAGTKVVVAAFLKDILAAFENGEQPASLFPDVTDPDEWFYPYVYAAQAKNVVHGYTDGYFKPGQAMTRADMAKVVCIAAFGPRECSEMGEKDRPYVFAVMPNTATLNESTVFTVEGFNLPEETAFWIGECENVTPLSGGTPEQRQFECTTSHTAGIKNGVVKDKSGGTELVAFTVEVTEAQPNITVTSVSPLTVTLNQATVFTVVGTNLPDSTAFWIGECEGVTLLSGGTPEQRQFQCTPSWTTGVKEGVVKDQSGGTELFNFTVTVQEEGSTCTTPSVTSVSPLTVTLNERTTFTVSGSCLPDTTAFFIHQCAEQVSLGGTAEQRQFECTPSYEAGVKEGVVKNQPDGTELLNFNVTVQEKTSDCMPSVNSVSPLTATLDETTTFTVYGDCLPDTTAFFFGECAGMTELGGTDSERQFRCTPSYTPGIKDDGVVKDKSGGMVLHSFTVEVY